MPRGYRLFSAFAIACLIAAIVFGLTLQPEKPNLSGDRGYREEAANYQAGGRDCKIAHLNALPTGERGAKSSACAEAQEQHREATDSLIEARRSANAADAGVALAYYQTRISAWGFGAGILTLFAALAAAIFAERAAYHAKSSAESYRAREEAELIPSIIVSNYSLQGFSKNVAPTQAIALISNSAIFPDPPPSPVPFIFPGHGRKAMSIEAGKQQDFGAFNFPQNTPVFYFIGAIIYQTVFGDVKLMRAAFKIDRNEGGWDIYTELDWSLWEREAERVHRQRKKF